ncbi:hypothetical protein L7F22_051221, partial [Adiantum nelumboides]|nr:hypothetical protein [Adiantum nelumboides]
MQCANVQPCKRLHEEVEHEVGRFAGSSSEDDVKGDESLQVEVEIGEDDEDEDLIESDGIDFLEENKDKDKKQSASLEHLEDMNHNHDLTMDGGSQTTQERNHSLPPQREHQNHASESNIGNHSKTALGGLKIDIPKESSEKTISIVVELVMERPTSSGDQPHGIPVFDLTVRVFCRADIAIPTYNREAGEKVSPCMFPASQSFLMEEHQEHTIVLDIPIKGGAERSLDVYRWLLATFTDDSNYVLDVFLGCEGLGKAC